MFLRWLERNDRWLFPSLALLQCAPLLFSGAFPSVDGPAHVAISDMWAHWDDPSRQFYHAVFEKRLVLYPNLLCYFVLSVVVRFLDALFAERVFVGALVVAYPLAMRYAASRFGGQSRLAAYIALPLAYNATLFWGFYNFHAGLIAFAVFAGFMFSRRRDFSRTAIFRGLAIAAFLYIAHLSAVVLASAAAALAGLGDLWSDVRARRKDGLVRIVKMGLWSIMLLGLPIAFVAAYLGGPSAEGIPVQNTLSAEMKVLGLVFGKAVIETPYVNLALGLAVTMAIAATLIVAVANSRKGIAAAAALAIGMAVFYLAAPSQLKVRWIDVRLSGFVLSCAIFVVAAGLAAGVRMRRSVAACMAISIALSVWGVAIRCAQVRELGAYLAEYRSASEYIPAGSVVLGLRVAPEPNQPEPIVQAARYLIQGSSYFSIQSQAIDAKLFQANTRVVPIQYRSDRNPYRLWTNDAELTAPVPTPNLLSFESAIGIPLDYVMVWGSLDEAEGEAAERLRQQLSQGFELIYHSRPSGLGRLYGRAQQRD